MSHQRIQEILFDNKESIPDGVYLQLMNCLVPKPKDEFVKVKKKAGERIHSNLYNLEKTYFFSMLKIGIGRDEFIENLEQHQLHDLVIVNANTYDQYTDDVLELWEEYKN